METRFVGLCKRWMVANKPGTASRTNKSRFGEKMKKRVLGAVEDYLEKCAQVTVKIDVVESLLRPENFLRNVSKPTTYCGSNIFQLLDTSDKPNHFVASKRRCWKVRK